MTPLTEKFVFLSPQGHELAGRLDSPVIGQPRAYAVFAHCFSCSKDLSAVRRIVARLTEAGIAVLRFDFTGLGHSGGEFANSHFQANIADLSAAIEAMNATGKAPSLLIGHSLGGAAVLCAGAAHDQIKAVATVGAPFDPAHALDNIAEDISNLDPEACVEVTLGGRPFRIDRSFVDGMAEGKMVEAAKSLRAALLVLHSPIDATVGIDHASQIFLSAKHPKAFVGLDTADHLLTKPEDAAFVGDTIATWAGRYIDLSVPDTVEARGQVVVTSTGLGKFQQHVLAAGHVLTADEPKSYGGFDSGPAPYDFLMAGLGACTNMTLALYAERKNLPLKGVTVALDHGKIHAKDCAECETKSGKIDHIKRTLTIEGDDLTPEQRQRLLEIADMCPVHRSLHGEFHIETELA